MKRIPWILAALVGAAGLPARAQEAPAGPSKVEAAFGSQPSIDRSDEPAAETLAEVRAEIASAVQAQL